ncbi:hypothetical protein G6F68_013083 [Rhizopus microsporus]|nr:hypothetical protein G6F68_013083 [Rhizopus microsporus]
MARQAAAPMRCARNMPATRRWATSRRTPGTMHSAHGMTAAWINGCPPRAAWDWAPTPATTSPSRRRWPTPSPCATPTIAHCTPAPIPTGCSCGRAPMIRRARPAAPRWSTLSIAWARPMKATPGPPTPNACKPPAWTGASTSTWRTTSTTPRCPASGSPAASAPAARPMPPCATAACPPIRGMTWPATSTRLFLLICRGSC